MKITNKLIQNIIIIIAFPFIVIYSIARLLISLLKPNKLNDYKSVRPRNQIDMIYNAVKYRRLLFVILITIIPVSINAKDKNKQVEGNNVIACYFISDYNPNGQKNIIKLDESTQRIEFTDEIGPNHGGGTLIDGSIIENGKTILIKIETCNSIKNDSITTTNTIIQMHYIDSTLLPRKIPVEGMLLKGFIVIEKIINKHK